MPTINEPDVALGQGYLIVIPGRADSDIVRTEKKYDRHFMGEVVRANGGVLEYRHEYRDENNKIERVEYEYTDAERGDIVFYDYSDAIETQMIVDGKKERVEIIGVMSVVAMVKKESLKRTRTRSVSATACT